jgi:polysaccharide deacetylase 2 family uncharacterized protein YibQ
MAALGQRRSGWRGLGLFWGIIIFVAAAGAALLQMLGPPAPGPVPSPTAAEAAPAVPASPPPAKPAENRIAAPDPALLEVSKAFPPAMLPRIAADGRTARAVYARPFDPADKRPRIGLVVTGLGMSDADSRSAIETLPGQVTLAFSPYASNPDALLELARGRGHEMLVSIPMEPQGYPLSDAGSHSLLTGAEPAQNRTNLEWALSRIQGYVGATGALDGMRGERFADQSGSLGQVVDELGRRGLLYVDPRPGAAKPAGNTPSRSVDVVVDDPPARAEIEGKLAALERIAREKGSALGLSGPLRPVTIERIAAWAKTLDEKGIALAPVTALMPARAK